MKNSELDEPLPLVRQQAIKTLLSDRLIPNQKTLVQLLKDQFGIEANQSVVSRDLRHLGVTKKKIDQKLFYTLPALDTTTELLKLAIVDIQYNEMMVVIKTHPGLAAFIGDYLDQKTDLEILGCVAGENIVFVAPVSINTIEKTYQQICQKLYFKQVV